MRLGRYWEWNDAVVAHPKSESHIPRADYERVMVRRLGFDLGAMMRCIEANDAVQFVQKNYKYAKKNGVRVTPTYRVGGETVTLKNLVALIED